MEQNSANREAARYWMIAPMESKSGLFETVWEYDRQHGTIAIGWCCENLTLQDMSQFTKTDEFQAEIRKHEPDWLKSGVWKIIWDFHCEMQVGDIVIARRGFNEIIGIGIVKKTAYYDFAKGIKRISTSSPIPEKLQKHIKPRFVEVFWVITGSFSVQLEGQLKLKHNRIFQEITEPQYQKLLGILKGAFKDIPDLNARKTLKIKDEAAHQEQQPERKWIWGQQPRSSRSEPNYYLGIDLGTTNSIMAWGSINPRTNQLEPKIVPINMMTASHATQKKPLLPSYIYFEKGRPPNVGEYAKKMLKVAPDRVVEPIKHLVGAQNELEIDGTVYTPAQFLALILIHLAASAKSHFGFIPDNAIITVPAYFNTKMRAETIKAAELAGFRTTDDNGNPRAILLDQPYAVLYDRINQEIREEVEASLSKSEKPKIVLIFDLGGGAVEVSLHQVSYKKKQDRLHITPLARSYNQIGGNSFDELLAAALCESFESKFSKPDLDDFKKSQYNNAFRQYAEQAKIDLSKQVEFEKKVGVWEPNKPPDTVTIPPIIGKPLGDEVFELYEGFSLKKYEEITAELLTSHLTLEALNEDTENLANNNIIYPILEVLRKFKHRIDITKMEEALKEDWPTFPQADVVLLNGSMTKLHTIQKRLKAFFGSTPILLSSDGAVARGTVVFHYNSEHCRLKSPSRILPEPIKIEITAKKYNIFHAGTPLPISISSDLPLQVGSTSAKLTVKRIAFKKTKSNGLKSFPLKTEIKKLHFGRSLKEKDLPLSMLMSINEQGKLNVEIRPKGNPDEKFTVTVNLEELWQERFTQNTFGGLRYLNIDSEIAELIANFRQLKQTKNLDIRRQILNRIETQRSRIVQSPSVEEFVSRLCKSSLCEKVSSLDNLEKMLVMHLLGDLAGACSDKNCLYEICNVATKLISSEDIETNDRNYVNTVVRSAVETIGKTRIPPGNSVLFDLLNLKKARNVRWAVIYSIGKRCVSIEAVDHLRPFIKQSKYTNRKQSKYTNRITANAANWALGKIGSRENEKPLSIEKLTPVISSLMEHLEMDCHIDIKRNSIYALAEICDRRRCVSSNIVSSGTAAEVILLLVTFLTNQMRDTLSDSTSSNSSLNSQETMLLAALQNNPNLPPSESSPNLQETTLLAIQMIRGIDLSSDQEASLRAIRQKN